MTPFDNGLALLRRYVTIALGLPHLTRHDSSPLLILLTDLVLHLQENVVLREYALSATGRLPPSDQLRAHTDVTSITTTTWTGHRVTIVTEPAIAMLPPQQCLPLEASRGHNLVQSVLPQVSAQLRAAGIADDATRAGNRLHLATIHPTTIETH